MNLPISTRLLACCQFINPGDRVADIGCDHGYLGIYLLKNGLARSVIAADINRGPLESAMRNARKYGTADRMSFHLSDGVKNIPKDFDVMVCAGMGADTMISILESAPWLASGEYRLILQCQSKVQELRKYLYEHGFQITRETVLRDGRFLYTVMVVTFHPSPALTPGECYISAALLASGDPDLPEYLQRTLTMLRISVNGKGAGADANEVAALSELEQLSVTPKGEQL